MTNLITKNIYRRIIGKNITIEEYIKLEQEAIRDQFDALKDHEFIAAGLADDQRKEEVNAILKDRNVKKIHDSVQKILDRLDDEGVIDTSVESYDYFMELLGGHYDKVRAIVIEALSETLEANAKRNDTLHMDLEYVAGYEIAWMDEVMMEAEEAQHDILYNEQGYINLFNGWLSSSNLTLEALIEEAKSK